MEPTTNNNHTNNQKHPNLRHAFKPPNVADRKAARLRERFLAGFRLCGFLARFDALHMQRSPFAERCQRRIERLAERRQCVLDARRDFLEIPSLDDAIGLHLLEMLDQHLLADPFHHTAQFSETAPPIATPTELAPSISRRS